MASRSRLESVCRHVLAASAAGALLGGLNAACVSGLAPVATVSAFGAGAGVLLPMALGIGVLQALLAALAVRALAHRGWDGLRARGVSLRARARDLRVALACAWLLGIASLLLLLGGLWLGFPVVGAIQSFKARRAVLLVLVGAFWLAGVVGSTLVAPLLQRLLAGIDARVGVPWPRSPALRVALYVLLPTLLAFSPLLAHHQDELAMLVRPLGWLVFVELDLVFWLALRATSPRVLRYAGGALATILVVVALRQPWSFVVGPARAAVARGTFTAPALRLLRKATDRDRDGFSALYGGGDCAPANSKVFPGAFDVPDNDVDENCDGVKASLAQRVVRPPLFSGARSSAQPKKYNVLWIVIDAVRADSLEPYGYSRRNAPQLQAFAQSALLFENAYSPSATTHLSFPAFLIGKNVENMRWEYAIDRARVEAVAGQPTLAERLAPLGYRSAAVVSPFIARLPSIVRGFDRVVTEHRNVFQHDGQGATGAAIDALALAGPDAGKPFFLLAYYEDPHVPYDRHGEGYPSYGESERDLYDGEIAFVDRSIGVLLDYLKLHPQVYQDTIVIVTSDHGEEFEERGGTSHGKSCHEESVRVPLLVRIPGQPAARVATRVASVDIVPTILELVGGSATPQELDGRSLLGALDPAAPPAPVYCAITNQGSTLIGRPFYERSVRYADRVLVHELVTGEYGLFDARTDRGERTNLAGRPEEQASLTQLKDLLEQNARGDLMKHRRER